MGKDRAANFYGSINELKLILSKYLKGENKEYDELTLNYQSKWIWIYTYNEEYGTYLDINFSKDFTENEIELFIDEMQQLGFHII
ncbi:MAG: hypothetical protein RL662_755 [Bacteroidota bacterium]|jgi:hypothetical protein